MLQLGSFLKTSSEITFQHPFKMYCIYVMKISIHKSTKEPPDIKRDLFPYRVRERTMLRLKMYKNVAERCLQ